VESLAEGGLPKQAPGAPHDRRAAALCEQAMRATQTIAAFITAESALTARAAPIGWTISAEVGAALAEAERAAKELDALQRDHRAATLAAVAPGKLTATDAFARIEVVRRLDWIAHHAWRSAAHLLGRGGHAADAIEKRPDG